MLKMNRFTAYESSVSPMITWKVRGRSTSQTPGSAEHADDEREQGFHLARSRGLRRGGAAAGWRCARIDWCASAVRMRSVAPTTTANTPRSKKVALGRCTSPTSGSVDVRGVGREEGIAERDRAEARDRREQQPDADPARRAQPRARLHPARPGDDVLHEERDRDDEAGDEAAARLVVPAQEEVRGDDERRPAAAGAR